jgi:hypothetical protein
VLAVVGKEGFLPAEGAGYFQGETTGTAGHPAFADGMGALGTTGLNGVDLAAGRTGIGVGRNQLLAIAAGNHVSRQVMTSFADRITAEIGPPADRLIS